MKQPVQGYRVVFPEPHTATLERFEVPAPGPGEVRTRNLYSVISAGTERANLIALPNTEARFPKRPGYCAVGIVDACGEGVTQVKEGERVLVYFGGHRTHSIQKADGLVKVPENVSSLDAAFVVIGGMGLQGVRKLKLELGESTMVIGLGLLGLFAARMCVLAGTLPVFAIDYDEARLAIARSYGVDATFRPDDPALADAVSERTAGRGMDAIVEVTGAAAALEQALTLVARQGRIALLGCTRVPERPLDMYTFVHKPGVHLIGAHTFVRPVHDSYPGYWTHQDDHRTLLQYIAAGKLDISPLRSEVVSPEHASEVYARLADNPCAPLGIVFDWKQVRI